MGLKISAQLASLTIGPIVTNELGRPKETINILLSDQILLAHIRSKSKSWSGMSELNLHEPRQYKNFSSDKCSDFLLTARVSHFFSAGKKIIDQTRGLT